MCQSSNQKKSWLLTKQFETKDYELVRVEVVMSRVTCHDCSNKKIKVYILHQKLPQEGITSTTTIELLKNLTLVATLANKVDLIWKAHSFQFKPKEPKFSLVFLSEGSCTRIGNIEIFSFACEGNISHGVILTRTVAPATGFKRKNATCIKHSLNIGNAEPHGFCSNEGIWSIPDLCTCKNGFTLGIAEDCVGRLKLFISFFYSLTGYD